MKKYSLLLVLFLIGAFVFLNVLFLRHNERFIGKDAVFHIGHGIRYLHCFSRHIGSFWAELGQDIAWPNFYHMTAGLLGMVGGMDLFFLTPTLFLAVLLFTVYKFGEFLKDRETGFLSALILSLYPSVYVSSRIFDLELALAAMTCAVLFLLIQKDRFDSMRYSVFFGICLGAGLLVKQTILFFIIGPLVLVLFQMSRSLPASRLRLRNLLIGLCIGGLVAYCLHYKFYFLSSVHSEDKFGMRSRLFNGNTDGLLCVHCYSPQYLFFHLGALKRFHLGIVNLSLFFIALPFFFYKYRHFRNILFLSLWLGVSLTILTIMTTRFRQYSISTLPVYALVTALGVSFIRPKAVRWGLVASALVLNLPAYFNYTPNIFPKFDRFVLRSGAIEGVRSFVDMQWEPVLSRDLNPAYPAAEYLHTLMAGKSRTVGVLYYITDEETPLFLGVCLANLLHFYSEDYRIVDFIRDSYDTRKTILKSDYFVFIRSASRAGQWLEYDQFLRDLDEANGRTMRKVFGVPKYYIEKQDNSPSNLDAIFLSGELIRTLAGYGPKLRYLKSFKAGTKEFLIYENGESR